MRMGTITLTLCNCHGHEGSAHGDNHTATFLCSLLGRSPEVHQTAWILRDPSAGAPPCSPPLNSQLKTRRAAKDTSGRQSTFLRLNLVITRRCARQPGFLTTTVGSVITFFMWVVIPLKEHDIHVKPGTAYHISNAQQRKPKTVLMISNLAGLSLSKSYIQRLRSPTSTIPA